jgi:hypothetical protein
MNFVLTRRMFRKVCNENYISVQFFTVCSPVHPQRVKQTVIAAIINWARVDKQQI